MSEFLVEKRRESADLTLVTGATLSGVFFLAGSSQLHTGPERVGDVMNRDAGFFPFGTGGETTLINRAHVVKVTLPTQIIEAQLDSGYDVATRRQIKVVLTTGETITGQVAALCSSSAVNSVPTGIFPARNTAPWPSRRVSSPSRSYAARSSGLR